MESKRLTCMPAALLETSYACMTLMITTIKCVTFLFVVTNHCPHLNMPFIFWACHVEDWRWMVISLTDSMMFTHTMLYI